MSQGSVSIASDGSVTKSGLAGAIYDARTAAIPLAKPQGGSVPGGAAGVPLKHGLALDANALAAAIYPELTSVVGAALPPGSIAMFGGAAAPTGWLLCNAASVLRATYPALFAAIGTTFGAVDGAHFTLPDLRGRVPLGVGTGDAADATAHVLGQKAGTETHTLTTGQIPTHSHGPGTGTDFIEDGGNDYASTAAGTDWAKSSASASAGGGGSHPNMQPYLAINFIIKT